MKKSLLDNFIYAFTTFNGTFRDNKDIFLKLENDTNVRKIYSC